MINACTKNVFFKAQNQNYMLPQQFQLQTTQGKSDTAVPSIKTGLLGAGIAGVVTYLYNGQTIPLSANENVSNNALQLLNTSIVQPKSKDLSFIKQKEFLRRENIIVNTKEELEALRDYAKTGAIPDKYQHLEENISKIKIKVLAEKIKNLMASANGVNKINEFLKKLGLKKRVTTLSEASELIKELPKKRKYKGIKKEIEKELSSDLKFASIYGKETKTQIARETDIQTANQYLQQLQKRKTFYENIPEKMEDAIKYLKSYGYKGTKKDLIKRVKQIKKIKKDKFSNLTERIAKQKSIIENLQKEMQNKIALLLNSENRKKIDKLSAEQVKQIRKSRILKAGKFALITGIVTALATWCLKENK